MDRCADCTKLRPQWSGLTRYCNERLMFVVPTAETDCDQFVHAGKMVTDLLGEEEAAEGQQLCRLCVVYNGAAGEMLGGCTVRPPYRSRFAHACHNFFSREQLAAPDYGRK